MSKNNLESQNKNSSNVSSNYKGKNPIKNFSQGIKLKMEKEKKGKISQWKSGSKNFGNKKTPDFYNPLESFPEDFILSIKEMVGDIPKLNTVKIYSIRESSSGKKPPDHKNEILLDTAAVQTKKDNLMQGKQSNEYKGLGDLQKLLVDQAIESYQSIIDKRQKQWDETVKFVIENGISGKEGGMSVMLSPETAKKVEDYRINNPYHKVVTAVAKILQEESGKGKLKNGDMEFRKIFGMAITIKEFVIKTRNYELVKMIEKMYADTKSTEINGVGCLSLYLSGNYLEYEKIVVDKMVISKQINEYKKKFNQNF